MDCAHHRELRLSHLSRFIIARRAARASSVEARNGAWPSRRVRRRWPTRSRPPGAAWRRMARETYRQSGRPLSYGSVELLELEELGSHAGSETIFDGGADGGRAHRGAG